MRGFAMQLARQRTDQRGFSLIEVLVALVVLSIGMLGIAALYVDSLRSGRTAIHRTQAVILVSDMAERIRANPDAGIAYAGPAADNNCTDDVAAANDCTAAQMAADDLQIWQQTVAGLLPNGQSQVQFVAGAGGVPATYTITVTWNEVGQAAPVSYVLTVQI
jgi:type IV pilus assembly protein PilV